jgi:hypothetical protein
MYCSMKKINLLLFFIFISLNLYSQLNEKTSVKSKYEEIHLNKLDEPIRQKWTELKGRLDQLEGVKLEYKKSGIFLNIDKKQICTFVGTGCCLFVEIIRGDVKSKDYFTLNDPQKITEENSWEITGGDKSVQYLFSIHKNSNIEYIFSLIKQKYDSFR